MKYDVKNLYQDMATKNGFKYIPWFDLTPDVRKFWIDCYWLRLEAQQPEIYVLSIN